MKQNSVLVWWKYSTKPILFYWFFIGLNVNGFSQTILNGSFEINNAPIGSDKLDLTNVQFNNLVPYCYSFGSGSTNIDLITTENWDGKAQNGKWYIGIGFSTSFADMFSMELSDLLIQGQEYKLTFYDNARNSYYYTSGNVEIGISMQKNEFGYLIYTTPHIAEYNKWTPRVVSFNSPVNGKFITVRVKSLTNQNCWIKVDNFCLQQDKYCIDLPEIEMPNVFTPNNDGINDNFKPAVFKGMNSGVMMIMNRWGQVIFETNDMQTGWDGTYNGKPVSDGAYFWKINYETIFEEEKTEYGYLMLLR